MFGNKKRHIEELKAEIVLLRAQNSNILVLQEQLARLWRKHDQLLDRLMSESLLEFKQMEIDEIVEEQIHVVDHSNLIGTIVEGQNDEASKKENKT